MSRKGTGISFIIIGIFLIFIRYLSAALIGSSFEVNTIMDVPSFDELLDHVGGGLSHFAIIFIIVGILYILWAIIEDFKSKKNK
ncbi:hypothetical protein [Oceanobacillus jeddahense]|uniref:Uncharacterized protein n=1 Tax=Oceanobacillus jeddahense TaxID=1462527 RepID=A0ABY5JQH5_9BACI|nr:hypothetical protein [Oceanobacillus jeddahense]UUI01403.1 hypothetical protein NP439_15235 [Oceanobacillus jeddahense]